MFHVDNVSIGDFGCYGGAYPLGAKTPNIDRFASESLMLTNYNVEAQCTPSRSALMTGRHPIRTGGHHRRQAEGAWLQQRLFREMALWRRRGTAADRQGF
jgi:arylsulfatase A-like enzyme